VYAIIKAGGKQYRVEQGATIYVERLQADEGSKVTLEHVLALGADGGLTVGTPHVAGASVVGTVVEQGRDHKVRVFKYKKRKHYRRTRGHRQSYTAVRIDAIQV
jgi:large subunit ribosomal protein L21